MPKKRDLALHNPAADTANGIIELRREEALLKAGALQNAIFNSANFSSIATDAKGVIQIFNVGAERMLGYVAADVINKITPADISDPKEVIARAEALSVELGTAITPGFEALVFKASRGIEDIYELTYIRKDGSRFPAIVSVTALRDVEDTIIGYLLIGTDNTARKQAEEALLKAGALQNAIFNSANFSSIATDAKGVIQIFNVGAERMLGYVAADVINKITPADISDPKEVIARAEALSVELGTAITPGFEALVFKASRGIEDIYELTYIRKDGSRFPAIVSVTALRDVEDTIIGYLLIGTDNTVRKQVEAEQKQLDQRLRDQQFYTRSLIESNIDAIMITDPSGIITDVNRQMETLTDCTRDELIGAPFKNHFTDLERAEMSIKLVLRDKKLTNYELTAVSRDGKETVVSYNATTIYDRDRKLQGVLAVARDVTERKRLDQVLQEKNVELENAKSIAEKANLAKSDFLSSMSHELRSPLNAILGFAQLMETDSVPPTPTQQARIAQILQAGWYLLELINEILDLALIESGRLSLSLEPMSLNEVLLECQAMFEPQAQKINIQMSFPQFDGPQFVYADRNRVKQVLINLLSNAIKYNREGGSVEVTCRASTAERIRISVQDTGEGLTSKKMAKLFQPFNRLGQEASGKEGTGIGLVMAKRLVELMGGVIGVESSVGVGSVFWIELNATEAPQLVFDSAEPTVLVGSQVEQNQPQLSRTVLYVEDNKANMELVEQLIARRPELRLLSASDGAHGIELAHLQQPTVILMDINLPGISGIQALKILRKDSVTAHIPVIAISANAMPIDIEKGMAAGFFNYLTKPIKVNEFMDALDMALEFSKTGLESVINPVPTLMASDSVIHNANILIVDDQEANVLLLERILCDAGYTSVTSTKNPHVVYELYRKNRYDLILLDLQMPGMNGFQVMENLKKIERDGYLPVLVITAQPGHKLHALQDGAQDFISKPFDLPELLLRIHNMLEVRLLHKESKSQSRILGQTVQELRKTESRLRNTEQVLSKENAVLDKQVNQLQQENASLISDTLEAHTLVELSEKTKDKMTHLAEHDVLTDLPNRILLNDRLVQAIALARRQGQQLAVMFLDLDRFKHINDSLGHAAGDQLLQSVARRLTGCVRSSDTVCRQGGDEFVILLNDIEHAQDAALSAQKMLEELTVPHLIDQSEVPVTISVSIGISIYPEHGLDADTLIKNADSAMYKAKESGRNNYQFFK